ncbi:hypothetical protein M758_12G130100 [Ceratodon purpureus]|nr:hypothetical protein M758_12G130100 [Ceratodon purpureus]
MEAYHGRRGRESNGVCGMNRGKQTMLLMLAMVVTMALVLVWEAFPVGRSGVKLTPIRGSLAEPGSDLEELDLRIKSFESSPVSQTPLLESTEEGTGVDDENIKGDDRSVNDDRLSSDSSSEVGSSAATQSDATPDLVDDQSLKDLPEVEQAQDIESNIAEEITNSTIADEKDERFSTVDVPDLIAETEDIEIPSIDVDGMLFSKRENDTEGAGALEAVAPFETLEHSNQEVAMAPESGETSTLEEQNAAILVDDKASGYGSGLHLNATTQAEDREELSENGLERNLTDQASEAENQNISADDKVDNELQQMQIPELLDNVQRLSNETILVESLNDSKATKNVSSAVEDDEEAKLENLESPGSRTHEESKKLSEPTREDDGGGFNEEAIGLEKPARDNENSELCNYTIGKWVLDKTRPLYSGHECPLWLSPDFACRRHNHPDKKMDRYRWQPEGCDLPTFNASAALETLRNKVIAFVGDSLGRQQYQSLLCMLTRGKNTTTLTNVGSKFNFYTPRGARKPTGYAHRFDATNTTIVFKWTVTLARVQPLNDTNVALHLDRPDKFLHDHLHQLDILIINSGHHWNNGKMKENHYQFYNHGKLLPASSPLSHVPVAYNQTVHNVVNWLHKHMAAHHEPNQVIYYRSLSPRHFRNGDWNTGGTCDRIRFEDGKQVQEGMRVDVNAESAVAGTRVRLLNVTSLSFERGETHVSKYGGGKGGQDCLHWCLPGVPDTWNEIMLAELGGSFKPTSRS